MLRNSGKLVCNKALRSIKPTITSRHNQWMYQPSALAIQSIQARSFSAKPTDKISVAPIDDKKKKDEDSKVEKKEHVVIAGLKSFGKAVKDIAANPKQTWQHIKDEAHHYWIGSKLLWSEMKITAKILKRKVHGHELTRRERLQLQRTTSDMLRLVPFAIFVIVPFMELLLPVALKLFPNMLPSTFEDLTKKEESLKKQLEMRLKMRQFMREAMYDIAQRKKEGEGGEDASASAILDFVKKAQNGEPISNDKVIEVAKRFKDDLTLPNMSRPQLLSMCRYMGLQPYGTDEFLRYQLRMKFNRLKEDDRRILWEGIDSLTTPELRDACQERGMRSIGYTNFKLKAQLQEWLELSTTKNIPISLMMMSRAFNLTDSEEPEEVLKTSMSSLDADTLNEVILASTSPAEDDTADMKKRRLESLKFQQEKMEDEFEEQQEALKAAKAKAEAEAAAAAAAATEHAAATDAPTTTSATAGADATKTEKAQQ